MSRGSRYFSKKVIERISERHETEKPLDSGAIGKEMRDPRHVKQFFKIAQYRKRQILERMLTDETNGS